LQVTQDIGIDAPIPISSKLGDVSNLFRKILTAAENPHLNIPEIESKKKRSCKLNNRSLMAVSSMFSSWIPKCLIKCFCISSWFQMF